MYDQDSIIVVSENNGDIIHTHAFSAFMKETRLDVLVCRKSDPESKGKGACIPPGDRQEKSRQA